MATQHVKRNNDGKPLRVYATFRDNGWSDLHNEYAFDVDLPVKIQTLQIEDESHTIEEGYLLLVSGCMYEKFLNSKSTFDTNYFGSYIAYMDIDLYEIALSSNTFTLGHYFRLVDFSPDNPDFEYPGLNAEETNRSFLVNQTTPDETTQILTSQKRPEFFAYCYKLKLNGMI